MISIKDFSIKKKLISIQLLTAFIVLLFYGVFLVINNQRVFRKSVISELTSMAQLIGANSISALHFLDNVTAEEILSTLAAEEDIVNAWIYDAEGNLFAKYSKIGYTNFIFPRIDNELYEFSGDFVTLSKSIIQDGDLIGMVSLRLNMNRYRQIVKQNILIAFLVLALGMVIALLFSILTQRTISNPILNLVETTKGVSETGNYSIRAEKKGNDEIGILCETFNDMMGQIQKRELERDSAEKTLKKSNEQLQQVIKERKHAEEELDRFFTLALDMFCIAGTDGYFKRINPAFERTLGYETKELLAEPFVNFVHSDDIEATLVEVQKLSADKNTISFENRYRCKDGSYKWLMWNSTAFSSQQLIYAAAHDITEHKRAEEELARHKEHLEELVETRTTELINANKKLQQEIAERKQAEEELKNTQSQLVQSGKMASLGMLVAGVAHEINTPVGAISSMYDTLIRAVEKLKTTLDPIWARESNENHKVNKLFKIIEDANWVIASGTERVTNIVRRLKSFARLDEAEFEKVDIHEGLEDTLIIVHHELKHKAIVERNFGDVPLISCNPSQLNQVYTNLLINAVHAIKDKGTITITTFQRNDHVHIQIKDSGIGIPEEALTKIFDPGYTTKGVGVGTGLGLSICYQIVKDHHGEILVESEIGKGTTFTIVLPKTPNA
jgi:PAS domain S-box-containing protein